jgi:AcrR family transcriptional regulator
MPKPVKRSPSTTTRTYSSPRRAAQKSETRRAIVRAAHDLFVMNGYMRTTIADIAREAGVSPETVYGTFGTKAALLHRTWDVTVGGDDEEVVFHERPEVVAIRNEPDLAMRLRLWATFSTATQRRTSPFMRMVEAAAASEPAAAEMLAEIGRQRLAGMTVMAQSAADTGQLAVSVDECRDIGWATTDGAMWHRLVEQRGWSDDQFAEWLATLWTASFVRPLPVGDPWVTSRAPSVTDR